MTNWEKFVVYMHEQCGMQFDEQELFVRCAECDEPVYKDDFDNSKPSCPCCTFNVETEEFQDLEDEREEWVEWKDE